MANNHQINQTADLSRPLKRAQRTRAAFERYNIIEDQDLQAAAKAIDAGYLFSGLKPSLRLRFVAATRLKSGIVALHYRRR